MSLEDLFLKAVELSPADRPAFLDQECAGDPDRRAAVEGLLRAHEAAGSVLEQPLFQAGPTATYSPPAEAAGAVIGRYKLVERIGEGGMGEVWLAHQTDPVKRLVALKVIKAGMDTKAVLARFEAERQALALMDHPNIAKVLDGGATPGGRPYFVMELVKGTPITSYCDEHRLTPRQRLELFVPVCQAVQHAHQKGIIHRDLKPSNVLVAPYDGKPVVKVIDFGVAKAAGVPLTEKTLVTGFGAVVGTPEYMSPEQAELNNQDIDTRSDVYSLGILLYELLTGSTPLTRRRAKEAALFEVLRLVREEEPPRPSTRLSTTEELPAIAASRGLEPRKLSGVMRGELDWIVMKALEKDRGRRYETANAFGTDVQHFLAGEPVGAHPPSAAYRLRKFVRRNRGPVIAAAMVFLTLVGGIFGTGLGLIEARHQADAARKAADEEGKARAAADDARAKAVADRRTARAVVDQMLTQVADEKLADMPQMELVRKVLLEAALRFYQGFLGQEGNDPTLRLEAGLAWRRVGSIYAYMGGQDAAAKHAHGESVALLEGLVAEDSRNPEYRLALAESQVQLANVMIYHMNDSDAGEARLRQARALQEELAAEHAGETAHYEALNQIEQGLAEVLHRRGKNADAEKAYGRAAVWIEKATDGSPTTLQADFLFNLAGLLISTLRKKEAEDALRQSLVVRAKVLAKSAGAWDRAANTWTLGRLAQLLADTGRPGEAEDAYCRAIKEGIDLVRDFPHVINNLSSLGGHYLLLAQLREAADQTGDAERLYRQAWTVVMDGVEPAHPPPGFWFARLHETEVCLVRLLVTADRRPEAATYLEQAELYWDRLAARSKAAVEYRRELAWTCRSLAEVLAADHRPGKAKQARQKRVSVLEEMVRLLTEKLGPAHPDTVATQIQLIEACESVGQMPDAEAAEVLGVTGPPPRLVPDRP